MKDLPDVAKIYLIFDACVWTYRTFIIRNTFSLIISIEVLCTCTAFYFNTIFSWYSSKSIITRSLCAVCVSSPHFIFLVAYWKDRFLTPIYIFECSDVSSLNCCRDIKTHNSFLSSGGLSWETIYYILSYTKGLILQYPHFPLYILCIF
jgi:hypothetical protein